MEKQVAIFYSEKLDDFKSDVVKRNLNRYNFFTIYIKDIDDVLLKKFSEIDFLALDLERTEIDDKSLNLIMKLHSSGYIKRVLVIKNVNDKKDYYFKTISFSGNFSLEFSSCVENILASPINETKMFDSSCVKIIGQYLLDLGFPLKQSGYSMLIDSIIYVLSKNCLIKSLHKDLYVYIASKYKREVYSVEIGIRKAVKLAYSRNERFPFEHCPTNKEMITYASTQLYEKIFAKKVI